MDIAVIGGSNGAYAAAADLAEQGHRIRLWRRDTAALAAVREAGGIELIDYRGKRHIPLGLITDDPGEAVAGADLLVSPLPAFAQADIARTIAPHLASNQVIYLPPGTFGSYVMAREIAAAGGPHDIAIAEAGTLPWLTRKAGPAAVAITTRATRLPSGVFPARRSEEAFAVLEQAFPAIERLKDGLDGALMNAGPIIHPPLILMNAGPIEHFEHWDIHNEGTQPAIRRVTDALDEERVAIREALGYGDPHFRLADHYDDAREEWMYGNAAHERLVDSGDWRESLDLMQHRYMREDVAYGLALLVSTGRWAGVATPVAAGLLAIASAAVGEDFPATGRTIESLELQQLTKSDMNQLLKIGLS
jgi:opine dehydrogenase